MNLPEAPLVDTHAHLDAAAFADDRDQVMRRAMAAGVGAVVTVGVDLDSSRAAVALAERYPMVVAAVGIHPHHAQGCDAASLRELDKLGRHERVVGIGETGLDYYRDRAPRDVQRSAFRAQLQLSRELGLPVIVHDREAHEDVLRMLEEEAEQRLPERHLAGVLHCFSGDVAMAQAADKLGFYVSVAGPVTYPKAERLAAVVRELPATCLLIETDCPFLTPQPVRGRRNEPAYVRLTLERIAALRSQPFAELARQTGANALRLFGPRLPVPLAGRSAG